MIPDSSPDFFFDTYIIAILGIIQWIPPGLTGRRCTGKPVRMKDPSAHPDTFLISPLLPDK